MKNNKKGTADMPSSAHHINRVLKFLTINSLCFDDFHDFPVAAGNKPHDKRHELQP
jgi:hypothetical protein